MTDALLYVENKDTGYSFEQVYDNGGLIYRMSDGSKADDWGDALVRSNRDNPNPHLPFIISKVKFTSKGKPTKAVYGYGVFKPDGTVIAPSLKTITAARSRVTLYNKSNPNPMSREDALRKAKEAAERQDAINEVKKQRRERLLAEKRRRDKVKAEARSAQTEYGAW